MDSSSHLLKKVWNSKLHQRHKLLWWQLVHNILSSCSDLNQRFSIPSSVCPFCEPKVESTTHLFLLCQHISLLWFMSPWSLRTNNLQLESTFLEFLQFIFILGLNSGLFLYALVLIETIWQAKMTTFSTTPSWTSINYIEPFLSESQNYL